MLHLYRGCWYAVFTSALGCFRPNPALVSPALAPGCSHSGGIRSSGGKALHRWGGQRAQQEEAMKAALGWARVIFLVCLIGVSHDISLFHLASCSEHKGKGSGSRFGWASGGRGDRWSCRSPHGDPAHRDAASAVLPCGTWMPPWASHPGPRAGPVTTPPPFPKRQVLALHKQSCRHSVGYFWESTWSLR